MDEFWRYIQTLVARQDTESYLTCPVHDRGRRPAYDRQPASTSSNGFADGSYRRGHSILVEAIDKYDGDLVRNELLLASTIDEEHFAFLSLIYIIFSVATLVCIELK